MPDEVNEGKNSIFDLLKDEIIHTIPKFQRQYNWTEKQAEDLWRDLDQYIEEKKIDPDSKYLFGQIIVYQATKKSADDNDELTNSKKVFYLIDGQQRLTTILLFITAARNIINNIWVDKNPRFETYNEYNTEFENYLRYNKTKQPRLIIDNENGKLLSDIIIKHININDVVIKNNSSKQNMRAVYNLFFNKLCDKCGVLGDSYDEKVSNLNGQYDYAEIISNYVKHLVNFSVFYVKTDNLRDAYRIFDRTNSRGLKLTTVDLIKSYIFSRCYPADKELGQDSFKIERRWDEIISTFRENSEQMFRYFYICKHGRISQDEMYDKITGSLSSVEEIETFLNEMTLSLDLYNTMYGKLNHFERRDINRILKNLKKVKFEMFYPLILSVYLKTCNDTRSDSEKEEIIAEMLYAIEILFVRNILFGDNNTNIYEEPFGTYAKEISKSNDYYSVCKNKVAIIYENWDNDISFRGHLINRDNWQNGHARYIMSELYERVVSIYSIPEMSKLDVEHIMPKTDDFEEFSKYWPNIQEIEKIKNQCRLGNLVLLENKINRKIKDHSFNEKIKEYGKLKMVEVDNGYLVKQSYWGVNSIEERTQLLADSIVNAWSAKCCNIECANNDSSIEHSKITTDDED